MSEIETRKSMDDVLASIRRIVRAEREGEDAEIVAEDKPEGPADRPEPDADDAASPEDDMPADVPLALTPDMMAGSDTGDATEASSADASGDDEPQPYPETDFEPAGFTPEEFDVAFEESPVPKDVASFVHPPKPADERIAPPPPDDEDLRALVRETVREELEHGDLSGRIAEMVREIVREQLTDGDASDTVREIIKAELTTGEIGGNISRNVLRLIRAEIAKANG